MLSSEPILDPKPERIAAVCRDWLNISKFPSGVCALLDLLAFLFRMYPSLLYFDELYCSADDPESTALNSGLRHGIEAAMIAVHISTVVLGSANVRRWGLDVESH